MAGDLPVGDAAANADNHGSERLGRAVDVLQRL
jgi:hypothetical protein